MSKKLVKISIVFALFSLLFLILSTINVLTPRFVHAEDKVQVVFFFGDGCPHCAKVEPVINNLKNKFPQVAFNKYEIYHNKDNALLLYKIYDQYNVPKEDRGGVPIVFVGKEYFMGDKSIIDNLEKKIISELYFIKDNKKIDTVNNLPLITTPKDALITPTVLEDKNIINVESDITTEKPYSLGLLLGLH